jgi:transketolase
MRNTVINSIASFARSNRNIFIITGDAGFGVLDEFQKNFPERFLNLGVAEQNMIGFAAGLALVGYKVIVYNIIPFLLYRCYEQVRNDICYQRLPVTLVGVGSGFTYAPQGITHYSVEDIIIARSLPNLVILSPCDPLEAEKCADFAIKSDRPVYIRVAKSGETTIHKTAPESIEDPIVIKKGRAVAVLFYGSVAPEVIKAVQGLKESPLVISVPMIQPLSFDYLLKKLKNIHTLVTVEEHFVEGGLGSILADWILKERLPFRLKRLGIKNEFIHAIKNVSGMRCKYGICSDNIKHVIKEAFRGG